MTLRVRVLAGCLAIGAAAFIMSVLSGAAAQAATLSVTHPAAIVQTSGNGDCGYGNCNEGNGNCGYQNCNQNCGYANCNGYGNNGNNYTNCPSYLQYLLGGKKCCKPIPTPPPPPCRCHTPTPSPTMTVTVTPPPRPTPTPVVVTTSPTPAVPVVATGSPVPTGAANTGGGMAGGSNVPLAAGGGAVALIAAPLGLAAFRRWRRTH